MERPRVRYFFLSIPLQFSATLHSHFLSPACIVTDKLQQIPLWVGEVQRFLSFVILLHSDDYIPLFLPSVYIAMGLGGLFQRIASINDWFYLPRLY